MFLVVLQRAVVALAILLVKVTVEENNNGSGGGGHCNFPRTWLGTWHHLGFPQPLNISENHISSKGTCVQQSGSRFVVADRYNCLKCMVIHEKHPNVLQYKESYCQLSSASISSNLEDLCASIESDSALFFMFRTPTDGHTHHEKEACPFGEHAFAYSTRGGAKVCADPPSHMHTCTNEAKMVLQFQACPDVPGSESSDEILECVAMWKEGSSRYLVGRLTSSTSSSSSPSSLREARGGSASAASRGSYTCFRYERQLDEQKGIVIKMSQSYRGSCEGLWSAEEGDRTYTLWKVQTELKECGMPEWLVSKSHWRSLNGQIRLQMTSGNSRRFKMVHDSQLSTSQLSCRALVNSDEQKQSVTVIAYQKLGCTSGYICIELTSVHPNVVHMRMGNRSRHENEACSRHFFSEDQKLTYLLADDSSIPCPFHGRFEKKLSQAGLTQSGALGQERKQCQDWIQSGCPFNSDMLIHLCSNAKSLDVGGGRGSTTSRGSKKNHQRVFDVTCVGKWTEPQKYVGIDFKGDFLGPTNKHEDQPGQNVTLINKSSSSPLSNVSTTPWYLVLRSQQGASMCMQYHRVSQKQLSVTLYNGECEESQLKVGSGLVYKGPCQEALTDASISKASIMKSGAIFLQLFCFIKFVALTL